jgi:hypothetical protein
MTRQEIYNYLNGLHVDNTTKNVAMFLIDKRHFAKRIKDIEEYDLQLLADNLLYNNEIVDIVNVDEYPEDLFTKSQYQAIKDDKKIALLNYYDINNNLKHCKILLDAVNYYNFKGTLK